MYFYFIKNELRMLLVDKEIKSKIERIITTGKLKKKSIIKRKRENKRKEKKKREMVLSVSTGSCALRVKKLEGN